jgi:hypothetical protein
MLECGDKTPLAGLIEADETLRRPHFPSASTAAIDEILFA